MVFGGEQAAGAATRLGQGPAMDGAAVEAQEAGEGAGATKAGEDGASGIKHGLMGRRPPRRLAMHLLREIELDKSALRVTQRHPQLSELSTEAVT